MRWSRITGVKCGRRISLKEGFAQEYGAREMDRVIAQQLKPLLMREILFGSLKQGGEVTVNVKDGCLAIG